MSTYTRETYLSAYHDLLSLCRAKGLGEDFGKLIAQQLGSERALRRMISYLVNAKPRSMEEIADEVVAIMEDVNSWREKKQAQESSAVYNAWLNSPERPDEE